MNNDESLNARLRQLAEAALTRTRAGQMDWRPMSDEDAFLFSGASSSLVVDYFRSSGRYELRVLNSRGTVVESIDGEPVDIWGEGQSVGQLLAELHEAARRNALDIDALLDNALKDVLEGRPREEPPF